MEKFLDAKKNRSNRWEALQSSYEKAAKKLEDQWKKVENGHIELQAKQEALAEENGGAIVSDEDVLDINAGGQIVRVKRGTLTQVEGSRLAALFSGRWEKQLQRDVKGRIFLDVNPVCFRCIVDYLNETKIAQTDDPPKPPRTPDDDNQFLLDCLLEVFGIIPTMKIDSTILTDQDHIGALQGFLKQDGIDHGLELLYRSSRDGLTPENFHQKCDNQGPTVTVVKSTQGYIFGGFSDMPWRSYIAQYQTSNKAFLFGLYCCHGTDPIKIEQTGRGRNQLYMHPSYGPTFGGGLDLAILASGGQNYQSLGNSYVRPAGQHYYFTGGCIFGIAELEVFKLVAVQDAINSYRYLFQGNRESAIPEGLPKEIQDCFHTEEEALAEAMVELEDLRDSFAKEAAAVKILCQSEDDEIIYLNVSGQEVAVKQSTLAQFPESVLYKQFVDANWQRKRKRDDSRPCDWDSEAVAAWVRGIPGFSKGVGKQVSKQLKDLNGFELLALEREDIKELGIQKPGTIALLMKAIQKLRDDDNQSETTFIEHSHYCFGKIVDQMRLKAMSELLESSKTVRPKVRKADLERYKRIVEYYFPDQETAAHFLPVEDST